MVSKILIADDHAIFRAGIRALIATQPDMEVVGEVDNGHDVLYSAGQLKPDLVLLDVTMPKCNGPEAVAELKRRHPDIKALVLTVHEAEQYVRAALGAGADGYVSKNDSLDELMLAIRSTLSGKGYLSPTVCGNVVRTYLGGKDQHESRPSWELLTHRERQVLKLVAEGYRNKDIAENLSVSLKTVEKHRSKLMKKLNLTSASGITAYAIQHGLVAK